MSNFIGFDIGGTSIRVAVMENGVCTFRKTLPVSPTYTCLVDTLINLLHEEQQGKAKISGIGIGLPGIAFRHDVQWVPNIPYLENAPLARDLEALGGIPVFFSNDAHSALLGEARFGAAQGKRNALLFSIGTGIGGAILISNRIYRGTIGAAGSFGWINLGLSVPLDPERGQLELLASGTALTAAAATQGITAEALIEAAHGGETEAQLLVNRIGEHLGMALATLVSVFDPEVVLISGGVSQNLPAFKAAMMNEILRYASPAGRRIPIRAAALAEQAGAFGATVLAAEQEKGFLS